jgi:hypothetical protein
MKTRVLWALALLLVPSYSSSDGSDSSARPWYSFSGSAAEALPSRLSISLTSRACTPDAQIEQWICTHGC